MRRWGLLLMLVMAAAPAPALAQSPLAEAARKAEQQRQANAGRSQAFTDKNLQPRSTYDPDLYGMKLSLDRIERYANARAEMVRAMLADLQLDARVSRQTINDFHDYVSLLAAEPPFAARLSRAGITPHDYVYTEGMLTIAEKLAASGAPPSKDFPPAVVENVRFYKVMKTTINELLAEPKALEAQLVARRTASRRPK